MQAPSRKTEVIVWGLLGAIVIAIVAAFVRERLAPTAEPLPALYAVAPFALTNQAGRLVSRADLAGKVWVADVIFTSCAGPCPRLSSLMAELQTAIPPAEPVRFISITTDPDRDTPDVLARYGKRYAADPARWHFLTGPRAQIGQAAVEALKFTVRDKDPARRESATDLFIHSTVFVVVDRRGWVRGVFRTDEPGVRERLLVAVRTLLKEAP